jgi:signal transduction histidine kinase
VSRFGTLRVSKQGECSITQIEWKDCTMHQLEQLAELGPEEKSRVEDVVATLTTLADHGETVAQIAHDARNMVTALDLYCDLLEQPGVLAEPFTHYGGELRLVAAASRRLVEKLSGTNSSNSEAEKPLANVPIHSQPDLGSLKPLRAKAWKTIPAEPIRNLAEELLANRNLLASLVGPTVALTVDVQGGSLPVRITAEDLTRILVNLARNASEAMSGVGRIHISLREIAGEPENCPWIIINVEDNGPGLAEEVLEKISEAALPSEPNAAAAGGWPMPHRGLGLSITRSIVEAAGGALHAANRDPVGACFQIELPSHL